MIILNGLPAEFYFIAYSDAALTQDELYLGAIQVTNFSGALPPEETDWWLDLTIASVFGPGTWYVAWLEFEGGNPKPGAEKVLIGPFTVPVYTDPIIWGIWGPSGTFYPAVAPYNYGNPVPPEDHILVPYIQLDNWDGALPEGETKYQLDLSGVPDGDWQVSYFLDSALTDGPYGFNGTRRLQVPSPNPLPDPNYYVEPPATEPPATEPTGGFVRHRDRMVQESVMEDLQNTLIACRWMAGTTTRPVVHPDDPGAGWQIVTVDETEVMKLVGEREDGSVAQVVLIDYFPEVGGDKPEEERRKTELNTLAIDTGQTGEANFMELGSNALEQDYVFTMAFYAASDAVALALMNDLRDRYQGRIVARDYIDLYNYNAAGFDETTPPIVRMEVNDFTYQQNAETVSPWEVHLYFAELAITDFIDAKASEG